MQTIKIVIFASLLLSNSMLFAQEYTSPELSVIGNFQSSIHNNNEEDSYNKLTLHNPEAEIHIDGNLSHKTKGHVVFGWHDDHSAELEEIYASLQSNSYIGFKVGKFLLDFDNLNVLHPHEYAFIQRPISYQMFFGNDGLQDMALETQIDFGSDGNKNVMFGVLQGDFMTHTTHEDHELEESISANIGYYGRIKTQKNLTTFSSLNLGVSLLNGVQEVSSDTLLDKLYKSWILGGDFRYLNTPSRLKSIEFLSNFLYKWSENELSDSFLKSYGYFSMFDYHFSQKHNIGALVEYVKENEVHHDEPNFTPQLETHTTKRIAVFGGYLQHKSSTTSRILVGYTTKSEQKAYWEMILQFVVRIGRHEHHDH